MSSRALARLLGSCLVLSQLLLLIPMAAGFVALSALWQGFNLGGSFLTQVDWPLAAWPLGMMLAGLACCWPWRIMHRVTLAVGMLLLVAATAWMVWSAFAITPAALATPLALVALVTAYRVLLRWPEW
jgi:hypothetical protein